ncbi:MAG: rod shape-determining protein MreC [Acidobacteriia bacterium]|nr:rod shape-determining protein MreC [Terriglobia bacterium]
MSRYRNVTILVAILFVQVLGLAVQVKRRSGADESTRIIRLWTVSAVTPLEKALVWCQNGLGSIWNNYVYLRGVRQENRELKFEIERLRLEQVRLSDDAQQARRLQALLSFKETYIAKTVAAQVIGSSGSEQSRSVYIDKGTSAGVDKDMAVITADGLVGRVLRAYGSSAQVLLINDQSSGVGVILDKSRLQGVIKGTASGEVVLEKVMTDEQVTPGERIVTSGGDLIFPKGVTVGTVMKVTPGADLFLNIRVKPSANLSRLEEVLVITKKEDRAPAVAETNSVRAVDILTQRLPSVPDKPPAAVSQPPAPVTPAPTPKVLIALPKPRSEAGVNNSAASSAAATAMKPATGHKPAAADKPASEQPAKLAAGKPAGRVASKPVVAAPGSSAVPSKPGPSQPGTAEDIPH